MELHTLQSDIVQHNFLHKKKKKIAYTKYKLNTP